MALIDSAPPGPPHYFIFKTTLILITQAAATVLIRKRGKRQALMPHFVYFNEGLLGVSVSPTVTAAEEQVSPLLTYSVDRNIKSLEKSPCHGGEKFRVQN